MSDDLVLVKLDGARQLLAEAKTLQEAKQIADVAEAARVYAKRVELSLETINYAAEIRIRAEQLLGFIVAKMPKNKGTEGQLNGPGVIGGSPQDPPIISRTYKELGLGKKQASRAQYLASIPPDIFEQTIAAGKAGGKVLTTAGVLRAAESNIVQIHEYRGVPDPNEQADNFFSNAEMGAQILRQLKQLKPHAPDYDATWQKINRWMTKHQPRKRSAA
ncbi:hypothetical protein BH20VER3_BH20VER3_00780 [soil metagenome]